MVFQPSLSINTTYLPHHFSHKPLPPSPPLLLLYNDVFSSLAFHRKRPLWKSIKGHMIGQQGRGQSGCKFDHHGLLLPRGPCAPSVSPPIVKLMVRPLSRSHWYSLPPLEIVLGSYVIKLGIVLGSYVKSFNITVMHYSNINRMRCFYLFVFLFMFYMFFCIYLRISKLKNEKVMEKGRSRF